MADRRRGREAGGREGLCTYGGHGRGGEREREKGMLQKEGRALLRDAAGVRTNKAGARSERERGTGMNIQAGCDIEGAAREG